MVEMSTMVVSLSCLQKEDISQYAHDNDISVSKLVRELLAERTGYDLVRENKSRVERRGRPRKYANDEERKEAARQRTADRDELTRKLMIDHQRQQRDKDAAALQAYLDRRSKG